MSNVIHPNFGSRGREEHQAETVQVIEAVSLYGEEAGYRVGLVQDDSGPEGSVLRVFVGEVDSDEVEAVALTPATPEGRIDADAIGMAILRTLEILGRDEGGSGEA
ncbi:hypothetical protein [Methylobacterium nigriterrae]|uniref:hypothetical protein n=1 Tax=Methylobacterium nigriterrae TaxID=3127512 RepID=UPI0030134E38